MFSDLSSVIRRKTSHFASLQFSVSQNCERWLKVTCLSVLSLCFHYDIVFLLQFTPSSRDGQVRFMIFPVLVKDCIFLANLISRADLSLKSYTLTNIELRGEEMCCKIVHTEVRRQRMQKYLQGNIYNGVIIYSISVTQDLNSLSLISINLLAQIY